MLLRKLFALHGLHDEVPGDTGSAGGGGGDTSGEGSLNVDIAAASDQIGADLGLGEEDKDTGGDDNSDVGSATPPKKEASSPPADPAAQARERAAAAVALQDAKKLLLDKKVDTTGKTDAQILELAKTAAAPVVKALPKSWKAEQKAIWDKLAPEAQAYIEQREAQVEEGFKANANKVRYGEELGSVMQPYEALLTAQGVKSHAEAVKYLMNAHYVLSTSDPAAKAGRLAAIMKSYNVSVEDLNKALAAEPAAPDPAVTKLQGEVKELRTTLTESQKLELNRINDEARREVAAFAADPAHPHFKDCAEHIMLLLQDPKISLKEAYEMAVWANPVTRAKEQERVTADATEKARKESEEKAAAAEKARGTRIKGDERHRASPDLLGSMEDTMRETMKTIKART